MKKGFTLVEMAMVLIVVGLLMGGGFQMMKVMQEKARSTEAKQTLEAAKEAVIGFVMSNNGVLPANQAAFNTLGFRGTGNTDINYVSDGALQVCNTTTTPLNTTDIDGVTTTQNIAFVLAIAGENMNVQTGRLTPADNNIRFYPWNFDSVNNVGVDEERTVLDRRTDRYDDFYIQVTLAELRSIAGCQPLSIINPSLHSGDQNDTTYSAILLGQGGSGNYAFNISADPQASGMTLIGNQLTKTPPPLKGTYSLTIRLRDTISNLDFNRTYALVIND